VSKAVKGRRKECTEVSLGQEVISFCGSIKRKRGGGCGATVDSRGRRGEESGNYRPQTPVLGGLAFDLTCRSGKEAEKRRTGSRLRTRGQKWQKVTDGVGNREGNH